MGGSNLITFTIDGTQYQAEEGMTWGEFVNSEYSDDTFNLCGGYVFYNGLLISNEYNVLSDSDIIINNGIYYSGGEGA